jgi:hypothetical protein
MVWKQYFASLDGLVLALNAVLLAGVVVAAANRSRRQRP